MRRHDAFRVFMAAALLGLAFAACDDEQADDEAEATSEEASEAAEGAAPSGARITAGEGLRIDGDTLVIEASGRRVPLEGAALVYGVHDGNIAVVDAGFGGGKITVLDATGDRVGGMELPPQTAGVLIDDGIVTYRVAGQRPGSPHVLTFHDLQGGARTVAQQNVMLIAATPDARGNLRTLNTGGGESVISYDAAGQRLGPDGSPAEDAHGEGDGHGH